MNLFVMCLVGYFVGSLPFGFLLMKHFCHVDIRKCGSKSTGTTNVLRTGNKKLAFVTLLLDSLKGFLFFWAMNYFGNCDEIESYIAAFCCVLGHVYPLWLRFNGGKGVATAAGIFLAMSPFVTIVCVIVWAVVAKFVKISSIASLAFSFSFVILIFFQTILGKETIYMLLFSMCVVVFLLYTHIDNIRKIMNKNKICWN